MHIGLWILFGVLIVAFLTLDLFVFHRESGTISVKEALFWSAVYIVAALAFNVCVYFSFEPGQEKAIQFFLAYVVEKALSADNIFVFMVIFAYFSVPREHEHRVLFWGVLGAIVMRGIFIVAGVTLIKYFHWLIYVFGVLLIYTAVKIAFESTVSVHPDRNPVLRLFRRIFPVTESYEGSRFLVRRGGKLLATPLLVVVAVVESTDVMFALDSIPAVLGISHDPLIVYTSNIFAILGLRALFFAIEGVMRFLRYLRYALATILLFIGVKMLVSAWYEIPVLIALCVVFLILFISVVASLLFPGETPVTKAITNPRIRPGKE